MSAAATAEAAPTATVATTAVQTQKIVLKKNGNKKRRFWGLGEFDLEFTWAGLGCQGYAI